VRAGHAARPLAAAEFDAGVVTSWCHELGALIKSTPGYSPPVASRAIGYVGVALYEALLPGMPGHRSLGDILSGLGDIPRTGRNAAYAWPVVASAAIAELARAFFPGAPAERRLSIERLEAGFAATAPRGIRERSTDRGHAVARAVFAWSTSDGGHEGYLRNVQPSYAPPAGPGLWEPTPPGHLPALQPSWGGNRRFVSHPDTCDPGPPPPYSVDQTSACFLEAHDVWHTVNQLDSEQRLIAQFWADDPGATSTPPGHSLSIYAQVAEQRTVSLDVAAEGLARLGMAVSDAFVACWRTKYRHNLLRPITYIRATIEPGWGDPLPVTTPPFPEYTSGHSVQSAAAAEVLTAQFGRTAFIDRTHEPRGFSPRAFPSFEAAAAEAAISRLYGGIHFRSAIDRGLEQGRCIGAGVATLDLR
jgi:hypothetical protein